MAKTTDGTGTRKLRKPTVKKIRKARESSAGNQPTSEAKPPAKPAITGPSYWTHKGENN